MRPYRKPGPKSKQRAKAPSLGDTDTDSPVENLASFRTPPRDENMTDYHLDISASGTSRARVSKVTASTKRSTRSAKKQTLSVLNQDATARIHTPRTSSSSTAVVATTTTTVKQMTTRRKQKLPKRAEFRKLLNRTDFMIPRAAFARVVREIMMGMYSEVTHFTALALEALQTAVEKYMENRFEDAYLLTLHARRVTLLVRDMKLVDFLLTR